MDTTTKTQAIKQARSEVGELYPFVDGWKFNSYDAGCNAWRESIERPYYEAAANRSQSLLDHALSAMGRELLPYDGGTWTDYL